MEDLFSYYEKENGDRESITSLYRDVLNYRNGIKFTAMLDFCARFRKLSVFNCALLATQRPGCRFALTPYQWGKQYHRVVKTDARPLVIIRPFGPVGFVFELGDTVPMRGFPDEVPQDITRDYVLKKEVPFELYRTARDNLAYWGVKYDEMLTGKGYFGKLETAYERDGMLAFDKPVGGVFAWKPAYTLKIANNTKMTSAFGTMLHEMGHLACRHIRCNYEKGWSDKSTRMNLTHEQEEFEAQTVAWLVGHRCGVDIPATYYYLAEYLDKDREIPDVDFSVMFQAANEVEKLLLHQTLKDGWLWKYTPSLQEYYKREQRKNGKFVQGTFKLENVNGR